MLQEIRFHHLSNWHPASVGLQITSQDELSPNNIALVEKAGFSDAIPLEAWSALGTNQQQAYSTHGLFRYFGKFPPSIATYLISTYTQPGQLIFDPMCGSGSTALECLLLNRDCVANDINPLSAGITKVKTTPIPLEKLNASLLEIEKNYRPMTWEEYSFEPHDLKNYHHWFLDETCDSLRGLKYQIESICDPDIKDFFTIIFASVIRRASKATTQQGRLFLDVETALPDAFSLFYSKAKKEIQNVSLLPLRDCALDIYNGDMRDQKFHCYQDAASLVILHPPYFNSYKYSSINSLESGWLGIDRSSFRSGEIKEFFKVGKPEKYADYVEDMATALSYGLSFLKPDGVLALMIGDSIIKGNYLPVTNTLIQKIDHSKYKIDKIAIRVPRYTEASWVASQRRSANNIGITLNDFIVLFRRSH
ncbi:hypothetical protein D3Z58_21320 [Clostridiaceae bacterium]|nr:hypothetical protein [Clostridiaceae bacterium]